MSSKRPNKRRRAGNRPGERPPTGPGVSGRTVPKSSYRECLERCEFSERTPEDFTTYLGHAGRWRLEYGPARDRGDFPLMRELEELLCV